MCEKGAIRREGGRMCFARRDVEAAIAQAAHRVNLPCLVDDKGITAGDGAVHIWAGGAATESSALDLNTAFSCMKAISKPVGVS